MYCVEGCDVGYQTNLKIFSLFATNALCNVNVIAAKKTPYVAAAVFVVTLGYDVT